MQWAYFVRVSLEASRTRIRRQTCQNTRFWSAAANLHRNNELFLEPRLAIRSGKMMGSLFSDGYPVFCWDPRFFLGPHFLMWPPFSFGIPFPYRANDDYALSSKYEQPYLRACDEIAFCNEKTTALVMPLGAMFSVSARGCFCHGDSVLKLKVRKLDVEGNGDKERGRFTIDCSLRQCNYFVIFFQH